MAGSITQSRRVARGLRLIDDALDTDREGGFAGSMAEKKKRKKKSKQQPGVFVDEVPSGARPIEAVGTAVAAFVGLAPFKPLRLTVTAVVVTAVVRGLRSP